MAGLRTQFALRSGTRDNRVIASQEVRKLNDRLRHSWADILGHVTTCEPVYVGVGGS